MLLLPIFVLFYISNNYQYVFCVSEELEDKQFAALNFLSYLNTKTALNFKNLALARWAHDYDRTNETAQKEIQASRIVIKDSKMAWEQVKALDWQNLSLPEVLRRQFEKYSVLGVDALPEVRMQRYIQATTSMKNSFSNMICSYKSNSSECDYPVSALVNAFERSTDPAELQHIWLRFRQKLEPGALKMHYRNYLTYVDEAAELNGFRDHGEFWLSEYDGIEEIKQQVKNLWEEIKPLYLQLHAYVRYKLRDKHGEDWISERGPIPAHLLGDIWAESWDNIADFTLPYPDIGYEHITEELVEQDFTQVKMYKVAENFYDSLGLGTLPKKFWERSIFKKPEDKNTLCQTHSVDFYDDGDFRVHHCAEINVDDFMTAHYQVGQIQYYMHYQNQPVPFRKGANSAFQDAVGKTIVLSVKTRKHLRQIGLLKSDVTEDEEKAEINDLYRMALNKIAPMPYAYIVDLWRWEAFTGALDREEYNIKWWKLRNDYQGVEPPINRTYMEFDISAKYHVLADIPYIQHFISNIIQFQFHKALCDLAGEYDKDNPEKPLHKCDIYQSTEAGNVLKKMLLMGSSKPWREAMNVISNRRFMDATGLMGYFKPLLEWLRKENAKNNVHIGWDKSKKVVTEIDQSRPTRRKSRNSDEF